VSSFSSGTLRGQAQNRGPDWHHELYIVKDDEKIPDVIARIMAIKALES